MPAKMDRCRKCVHFDSERSTENWTVLSVDCPRDVIIAQDSSQCPSFESREEA